MSCTGERFSLIQSPGSTLHGLACFDFFLQLPFLKDSSMRDMHGIERSFQLWDSHRVYIFRTCRHLSQAGGTELTVCLFVSSRLWG